MYPGGYWLPRNGCLLLHQAPGEAEAELAHLNHIGAIDAVMTDDVDTFIFGATHILRK